MRYIRQEIYQEIGKKGQEKLRKSTVAIVGLGALGSASANLLVRAGVGKLILIDRDIVELSNLQRQALFNENDIGKPKASQAKKHLGKINNEVEITAIIDDLNFENIVKIFSKGKNFDLILDCTDNMETRFLLNDFCVKNRTPFIYSSAVGSKGYIFNIIPNKNNACLRCFLKEATQLDTCETLGVLNTITNLISSLQVNEAIKILLKKGKVNASERVKNELTRSQLPETKLLFFDIWKNELLKIKVNRNKNCICCANAVFEYLVGKKPSPLVKLCGDGFFQIRGKPMNKIQFYDLKNKLKKIGRIADFFYCFNFDNKITIFKNGRALIKAKDENEAKSVYSKFVGN